jgi:hypothetical protein
LKKPNRTEPKPKKTGKNQAKPETNRAKTKPNRKKVTKSVFVLKNKPNRTETGRFKPVSVFLKKIWFGYFFLIKTESNKK